MISFWTAIIKLINYSEKNKLDCSIFVLDINIYTMIYIKTFENFENKSILIIVDVQRSFSKFYTEMYLYRLKEYARTFTDVYQIYDNHADVKNDKDKSYLYDMNHISDNIDLFEFPNQKKLIEKRYKYDVDVEHFKNIVDNWKELSNKSYKKGDVIWTKYSTPLVYIGNRHSWMHVPKKLYKLFETIKGQTVYIVGGADNECLLDIEVAANSFGINVKLNHSYIYSASHCPIKN